MSESTKVRRPGARMTIAGIVVLALGAALLVANLATTFVKYVPGVGTVETQGTPSAAAIILLVVGIGLVGAGFAKRLLAAVERN